jgi:opacity protein-like surface antigen
VPVAEPAGALAPPTSEPARFGGAAEVVITGAASLEASGSTSVVPQTRFLFAPSADVFVVRNFSVGGSLELGYLKQRVATVISSDLGGQQAFVEEHQRTTDWSVGPRVGVNLALGSFVSLYIRAGVSFGMAKTSVDPLFGPSAHFATHFVRAETSVPLLFHVAPHFFLGFGPELDLDLARSAPSTSLESGKGVSLGAFLTVGGWL